MSIKRFLKLMISGVPGEGARPRAPSSLARTAREAMHVRGGNMQAGGFSSTEAVLGHIAVGHEDYQKSFEKDE